MRKTNITLTLMLIFVAMSLLFPTEAAAKTLKMDLNGIPIQLTRYWSCVSDTIPAQAPAVYDSLAIPSDAAEVIVIGRHQALYIRPGSSTGPVAATGWIYIPKDVAFSFPVMDQNPAYIAYKSATGAASINLVWKRM
jgi:hypothetical protein